MAHEHAENATPVEIPTQRITCKRRRYNREYMRKWRSKPMNREMERKSRGWYCERKPRNEGEGSPRSLPKQEEEVCGCCGHRAPVTTILRLRVCDEAPGGYVEIRMPYCGKC